MAKHRTRGADFEPRLREGVGFFIRDHAHGLARIIVDLQFVRSQEDTVRPGERGYTRAMDRARRSLELLADAIISGEPARFASGVASGASGPGIETHLELMSRVLADNLPPETSPIPVAYIGEAVGHLRERTE